jgi:small subunit ribosomal protein S8
MDLISDMLARIRNACLIGSKTTLVKFSSINVGILNVLKSDGYISDFVYPCEEKYMIRVTLKYDDNHSSVIRFLRRISKSSRRVYSPKDRLRKFRKEQFSTILVSTSKGVMSHIDAIHMNLGGEVLCEVVA